MSKVWKEMRKESCRFLGMNIPDKCRGHTELVRSGEQKRPVRINWSMEKMVGGETRSCRSLEAIERALTSRSRLHCKC